MTDKVTIKDIADSAGVTIGTVHCALNGKPGVGQKTRERIISIAKSMNYHPNTAAASLKRKTVRIAASFPGATEESKYYFTYVWNAVRDCFRDMGDFNIELIEAPFYSGANSHADELSELLAHQQIDGLLTTGYSDDRGITSIQQFINQNIPVVFVGNDLPQSGRLCCVQPYYQIIGRMMAEMIVLQIPQDAGILICAGDLEMPSHYLVTQGIDAYIKENNLKNSIYKIHAGNNKRDIFNRAERELKNRSDIAACCSVNARGSVQMGDALIATNRAGQLIAIGSDLFKENVDFLKEGVFSAIIYKNPYLQAYTAAKTLIEYLIKDKKPIKDIIQIGSEIVIRSSLPMYDNHAYRQLI